MKKVFVSCRCYGSVLQLLKTLSSDPVIIPELPLIDKRTSYHTDLSLCVMNGTVVCAPSLYEKIKNISGLTVVKGFTEPQDPYPNDICYNAAQIGRYLFCKRDLTDKRVLEVAASENMEIMDIKQGYARCSIFPISETSLITSDPSVQNAALKVGLDVLKVSNSGIALDGYPNGFIGGTGGLIGDNAVFCGDISAHADYTAIKEFCGKYGVDIVFTEDKLRDFGSILC